MSPRAAWRLERLGYSPVYDYAAGKVDWMAAGLPTIRADVSERRALDGADRKPPTCRPDDPVADLAGSAGGRALVVINERGIVLGRFRPATASPDRAVLVEAVMEPGPTTVRAHEPLDPLLERMASRNIDEIIVTTPDGELLGVVRRPGETVTEPALDLFDDESLAEPVAEALRRLVIAGFHALWRGRTPTVAELAAGDPTAVAAAVDHLRARGRIEFSDDGRVIAVHGLARRATPHRIDHDDGAVSTWCALDAVGIPAAMRIDARAVTQCPTCGHQLTVTLSRGEPRPLPGAVLWYPEDRCAHLVDDFCSGANLFCSVDHLERWLGNNPTAGRVMTIGEAAELGRETWREASDQAASHGTGSDARCAPSPPPT